VHHVPFVAQGANGTSSLHPRPRPADSSPRQRRCARQRWWIGDRGGRPFLERRGRWFHLTPEKLDRAERWFERWGAWAVFVGRITPVARSFVSIPAGLFESPFGRYNVLTLLGNTLWCVGLAGAGWALGSNWDTLHHDFRYVEVAVVVGILAVVAYWILRVRRAATMRAGNVDSPH